MHQLYADITQVYSGISTQDAAPSIKQLKLCSVFDDSIQNYPIYHRIELLLIGTKQQYIKFRPLFPIFILDHQTLPAASARNIGAVFDSEQKFDSHVRQLCK